MSSANIPHQDTNNWLQKKVQNPAKKPSEYPLRRLRGIWGKNWQITLSWLRPSSWVLARLGLRLTSGGAVGNFAGWRRRRRWRRGALCLLLHGSSRDVDVLALEWLKLYSGRWQELRLGLKLRLRQALQFHKNKIMVNQLKNYSNHWTEDIMDRINDNLWVDILHG